MSEHSARIGHLDVNVLWGNAGGVVRSLEEVDAMTNTLAGWVEAGSYTLDPRTGNEIDPVDGSSRKIYNHDIESGVTANSLGMPNRGFDEVVKDIPQMVKLASDRGKGLIINVAPVTDNPGPETLELVRRAYEAGSPAVLVNLGCPNVLDISGERHEILCYNSHAMFKVLASLRSLTETYPKVFVRTSPYDSYDKAKIAYRSIENSRTVSAVWAPNTWPIQPSESSPLEVGGGGWSGPSKAEAALEQVGMATAILSGTGIDVVLSSGVGNYKERRAALTIEQALALGAVAAAGTTFYAELSIGQWEDATYKLLNEYILEA